MAAQDGTNFVITGIPRGGTSLLCSLINHVQNIVCLNEVPAFYDVDSLPASFHNARNLLRRKHPIPMMISNESGGEITDTQSQKFQIKPTAVNIDTDKDLAVGSKINVPYLLQIDKILSYGYKSFAVIRNPVYAIASWNKHAKNINEAHVLSYDFEKWPRYRDFKFETEEKFTRQAELYNHFMSIIVHYKLNRIIYEDMVQYPMDAVQIMSGELGIPLALKGGLPGLKNLNSDSRFQGIDLDAIRDAVEKYCPLVKGVYV